MAIVISGNGIDMGNSPISNVDIQNDVDVVDKEYADLKVALTGDQTIAGVKTFSSSPIAPTAAAGTNTTQVATTAFVQYAITNNGFGVGQVWTDVKASRALGVTYTNSNGEPIEVFVTVNNTSPDGNYYISITINGVLIGRQAASAAYGTPGNQYASAQFTVPNGITYSVASSAGSLAYWQELR